MDAVLVFADVSQFVESFDREHRGRRLDAHLHQVDQIDSARFERHVALSVFVERRIKLVGHEIVERFQLARSFPSRSAEADTLCRSARGSYSVASAANTLSGVSGIDRTCTPIAFATA